jgi:30S ribosomal protein 3
MIINGKKIDVKIKVNDTKFLFSLVWHKNLLGVAIDQVRGDECIPLTGYYYWPRSDAWSQILIELESKKWISYKEKLFLMDKTSEILNTFLEGPVQMSENEEDNMNTANAIDELATGCQILIVDMQ